jgi:KDO2-lipid IV(A) lauroyltransferase
MPWNVRLVAGLIKLGAALPLRVLHALGAALAWTLSWFETREVRVARRNVELVFPGLDERGRRRMLRETLAETGKGIVELAAIWGRPPSTALRLVAAVEGQEKLDAALAQRRGVLVAAPHLGSWELLNFYLSSRAPMSVLYRVPQSAEFEALLTAARAGFGAAQIRADAAGVRVLFRHLKEGRLVGILPDQRPKGGEGEDAPFFGHPAKTMTLLCRLAQKTGAPVLLAFAERLPRGAGFRIHFADAEPAIADADMIAAVAALNRGIESLTRLAPAQYQWTYKRFSFRRKGDPPDPIYGPSRRKKKIESL